VGTRQPPDTGSGGAGLRSTLSSCATYTSGSGAIESPWRWRWRFQGRILESADGSTDLYDFQARSYDPSLGAFTSLDSVTGSTQNPLTLNRFLYANANPATLVDPDGHFAFAIPLVYVVATVAVGALTAEATILANPQTREKQQEGIAWGLGALGDAIRTGADKIANWHTGGSESFFSKTSSMALAAKQAQTANTLALMKWWHQSPDFKWPFVSDSGDPARGGGKPPWPGWIPPKVATLLTLLWAGITTAGANTACGQDEVGDLHCSGSPTASPTSRTTPTSAPTGSPSSKPIGGVKPSPTTDTRPRIGPRPPLDRYWRRAQ
jgi:RHS repeat-associated protein